MKSNCRLAAMSPSRPPRYSCAKVRAARFPAPSTPRLDTAEPTYARSRFDGGSENRTVVNDLATSTLWLIRLRRPQPRQTRIASSSRRR